MILGIAGSIRSNGSRMAVLEGMVHEAADFADLTARVAESGLRFANSDLALAASMLSVKAQGLEFRMFPLKSIFKKLDKAMDSIAPCNLAVPGQETYDYLSEDDDKSKQLFDAVTEADGVILSSPVYFGDRSSVANKFMQLTNHHSLLHNKAFGMIGVGAKRNGGQETTCIYGLYDAVSQGAVGVGNGPKTAQYGGTVVSGDMGSAFGDDWGMERCLELGTRITQVARMLALGTGPLARRLRISVLMTMDTRDKVFRNMARDYFRPFEGRHDFDYIDLIDYDISRCVACDLCPAHYDEDANRYMCRISHQGDAMMEITRRLTGSDAIVLVGANTNEQIVYRYQAFTERTRALRRMDFQLNNTAVVGMHITDPRSINNPLHNVKVITSYIRHNTMILKPVNVICDGLRPVSSTSFDGTLETLVRLASGRAASKPVSISYAAEGYSNKSYDDTSAVRY